MKTITITEALSELKTLDKRIEDETRRAVFCIAAAGNLSKINGKTHDEVKKEMQSDYDRINALIRHRDSIKAALTKSNAETTINIGEKSMTIAEAIYHKTEGIKAKRQFLNALTKQYNACISEINTNNGEKLRLDTEKHLIALYGGKEALKDVNEDTLNKAREAFRESNTLTLIEGIDINKIIQTLRNEIDEFESKVDAAITISNATTEIDVE